LGFKRRGGKKNPPPPKNPKWWEYEDGGPPPTDKNFFKTKPRQKIPPDNKGRGAPPPNEFFPPPPPPPQSIKRGDNLGGDRKPTPGVNEPEEFWPLHPPGQNNPVKKSDPFFGGAFFFLIKHRPVPAPWGALSNSHPRLCSEKWGPRGGNCFFFFVFFFFRSHGGHPEIVDGTGFPPQKTRENAGGVGWSGRVGGPPKECPIQREKTFLWCPPPPPPPRSWWVVGWFC